MHFWLRMFTATIIALGSLGVSVSATSVYGAERSREPYSPVIIYPGPYAPEQLFYKNPKGETWLRWTAKDFNRAVTCPGALKQLKRTGVWQGHLKPNGSCGTPAEPSDWATGNWLNFYLIGRPSET